MRNPAPVGQAHTQRCQNAVLVCDNGRANALVRLSRRAFQRGHRNKHTILQVATAERDWIDMEILDWLIAGTSVSGLVVYCAGMTLLLGALAWANHHR
jgi:hypothetical protein